MTVLILNGEKCEVGDVKVEEDSRLVRVGNKDVNVDILRRVSEDPLVLLLRTGGVVTRVSVLEKESPGFYDVELNGKSFAVSLEQGTGHKQASGVIISEGPITVSAPMAGKIASITTVVGMALTEGQTLLVLEAMKMENEIVAPKAGIVREVYVEPGALVKAGDRLCLIE